MSETMLRRTAEAAYEADLKWVADPNHDRFVQIARAVLMAVRDLTPEMRQAIFDDRDGFVHEIDIPGVWEFGIDAILAQEPGA